MTIEDEAMAAFRAMDDQNQRELLKILKRTAVRAPRNRPAKPTKLSLVFTRSGENDFLNRAGRIKDEFAAVFVGRPKVADKA